MAELKDYISDSPMGLDTMGAGALNILEDLPFVGSIFGDEKAKRQQIQDVQLQKYLQDSQNEFTRDMYHEARDYESASEQMKRLKDAGLSEAAAAQALSGSSGVSQPTSSGSGSVTPLSQYQLASAEASKDQVTEQLLKSQKQQQDIVNSYLPSLQEQQIVKLKQEAKKAEEEGKLTSEQCRQQIELFDTLKDIKKSELDKLNQDVINAQEQLNLIKEQVKTQKTQQYVNSQTGKLLGAEAQTEEEKHKKEAAEAESAKYQAVVDKLRAAIASVGINPDDPSWKSILVSVASGNADALELVSTVLSQSSKTISSKPVGKALLEGMKSNPFTASSGFLLDYLFSN